MICRGLFTKVIDSKNLDNTEVLVSDFLSKKSDTGRKPLQKPAGACRTVRRSLAVGAGGSPPILILTILFGGGAGAPAPPEGAATPHALSEVRKRPLEPFLGVPCPVFSSFALQKLLGPSKSSQPILSTQPSKNKNAGALPFTLQEGQALKKRNE